jgi:hypothetical protein
MTRRFVLWLLTTIFIATAAAIPAWAKELYLSRRVGSLAAEDKEFIERLTDFYRRNYVITRHWSSESYDLNFADLNGDGIAELLVFPRSLYICGQVGGCDVSIYQKKASGWAYVGKAYAGTDDYKVANHLTVEDRWVNGWRTLAFTGNEDRVARRFCWVPSTSKDPFHFKFFVDDPLGMPATPGMAGYFGFAPLNEECPKDW